MKEKITAVYGSDPQTQSLDLYLPDTDTFPVFIYFHGGGLESGKKEHVENFMPTLLSHGIALASVEYRMYPTAHYPDFIEDAAAAVAWVKHNIGAYGNCTGVYAGGSSAGGYLSMMLCFDSRWHGAHGIDPTELSGWVHDAGQPTAHFNVLRERGEDFRRIIVDESAPLYHIGRAPSYSPMLFLVSDKDMHGRYEQTMVVLQTLAHFGFSEAVVSHRVMHGTHCHYVNRLDEQGVDVFGNLICDFILRK
jgi:hypothetical protein